MLTYLIFNLFTGGSKFYHKKYVKEDWFMWWPMQKTQILYTIEYHGKSQTQSHWWIRQIQHYDCNLQEKLIMSNLTNPSLTVIYGRISCNLQKNSQSANKKKSKIKGKLFKNVAYTVAYNSNETCWPWRRWMVMRFPSDVGRSRLFGLNKPEPVKSDKEAPMLK